MKNYLASLALCFGLFTGSVSVAQDEAPTFSPLQPAYNGLWFDPDVEGVVVQVYPFQREFPYSNEAFISVNEVTYEENLEKNWQAFLISDFRGFSRTAVEDDLIGTQGNTEGRSYWRFSQSGNTCDALVAERFGPDGIRTDLLDLVRIAPNNVSTSCYTCLQVSVGPFSPNCVR